MSCVRAHGVSFPEHSKDVQRGYRPRGSTVIILPSGCSQNKHARRRCVMSCRGVTAQVMGLWNFHATTSIAASDRLQARRLRGNCNKCQPCVKICVEQMLCTYVQFSAW